MIDKKEQFMLSLQGWTYKGILDNCYHSPYNDLGYNGTVENSTVRTCIPDSAIEAKDHRKNGTIILFLTDRTYYILGTKQNG